MMLQKRATGILVASVLALAASTSLHAQPASQYKARQDAKVRFTPLSERLAAHPSKPWHGAVVYAAPTSRGVVNVYKGGDKRPKAAIYSFRLDPGVANSLQVDRHGNLYLADTYSTWVFEYAPGTGTPLKSFPTSEPPYQIAVRSNTLYAFQAGPSGGDVSVQVYEKGSTHASRSLTDAAMQFPDAIAVDKAGNVFVGYDTADFSSGIGEFVGGQMPMVPLDLQDLELPLAMTIDPAGDLVVDNAKTAGRSDLLIYPPGETVPRARISNLPWLYQFSFTADGTAFYAGDSGSGKRNQAFQKYEYPSGKLIYSYTIGDAFAGVSGVAASPSAEPGLWGSVAR